jgi:hypothetical protein
VSYPFFTGGNLIPGLAPELFQVDGLPEDGLVCLLESMEGFDPSARPNSEEAAAAITDLLMVLLYAVAKSIGELTDDACFTATHSADVGPYQFQCSALAAKFCQRADTVSEQVFPKQTILVWWCMFPKFDQLRKECQSSCKEKKNGDRAKKFRADWVSSTQNRRKMPKIILVLVQGKEIDAHSRRNFGLLLAEEGTTDLAIKHWHLAAAAGHDESMECLGRASTRAN